MSQKHENRLRKLCNAFLLFSTCAFAWFTLPANAAGVDEHASNMAVQQRNNVTVTVVDETGEPVIGASVLVLSTKNGRVTDADGQCTLEVKAGDKLQVSYVGYNTQTVSVGASSQVKVALVPAQTTLEDVVVVGYGTAKAKDVSGAIASVKFADKEITNLPNPNALVALSSKVAGLKYNPTNSAGGDNSGSMNIRGKNAITVGSQAGDQGVNAPLFVVDGVIFHGSINEISTSDIQTIDVLKDASAAAIYGSRAANGVVIITTKKGTTEKPTVRFNSQWSFSDWSRMPKYVTDKTTFLENRFNSVKQTSTKFDAYTDYRSLTGSDLENVNAQLMNSIEQQAYKDGVWTNWLDEVSRTGYGQKYDANVSGQSKNVNYYISGDYTRQKGIMKGNDYEKYDIMSKVDINVNQWIKLGLKGNFLSAKSWGQPARMQNAQWMSPLSYVKVQEEGYTDWYNSYPDGATISPYWGSGNGDSYLWTSREGHSYNLNGVFFANIECPWVEGLSYRMTLSGYRNHGTSDVFTDPRIWVDTRNSSQMDNPSQFLSKVEGSSKFSTSGTWTVDNIFTYTKDIMKHHFDLMAGYTRESSNNEGLSTSYSNFSTPVSLKWYIQGYANQENIGIGRSRTRTSAVSYLGRANYNYASTYYATFNFRRDGYSAFAVGHKWGNFYGASAAWVLSNESFIKDNVSWLDYLKLRLSWGQNGNRAVSAYATTSSIGSWYTWLDNQTTLGFIPTNLPNRTLTWETVSKWNLGIDFTLLKYRLDGTIDLYSGKTTDMLVERSVPYPSGYQTANANVGKVTNKGIEVTLHSVNINGDGKNTFRWESNLTFDSNTNKIKSLFGKDYKGEESDDVANATAYGFDSYYALMVGHPIGAAYDVKKLGIFQSQEEIDNYVTTEDIKDANGNVTVAKGTKIQADAKPGDFKFQDYNNDGKIDANDRHYIGCMDPLFTVNFGNTLSYKNFSLYFSFRWMQGDSEHFLGYDPNAFSAPGTTGAQLARVHPWMKAGDGNTYPRYGYSNSLNYLYWNQRTFLKLKDLVFSYDFDKSLINKIGLAGLRLYVSGTDLFTITGWSGLDPEDGGTIAAGVSSSRYGRNGTYRTINVGANITF